MSDARDDNIERLFARANQELAGEEFVAVVMARSNRLRRRKLATIGIASLVGLVALGLVAPQLITLVAMFSQFIAQPIATDHDGVVAILLAPLNSFSGVFAVLGFGLWLSYRVIFAR